MKNMLRQELEAPEKQYVITGAIYSVACFFSLPFLMLLFKTGLENNLVALSWFDIAFHVLNFVVVFKLFREYLSDSLLTMQLNKDTFISVTAITVGVMVGIGIFWHFLYLFTGIEMLWLAGFGTIPMSEMNLFTLTGQLVCVNPVFGTLCMVALTPVTVSCLFYAIGFVPFYNIRPWLGYLVVCAAVAFPRVCNALSGWIPEQQVVLYLAQLPVHLIACWSYKKTDTVCAPIAAHMISNFIAGVVMNIVY
jgi:hypothetical protein